jgi:peptidoglycan/LPS O-acetylase OafA/YrhL
VKKEEILPLTGIRGVAAWWVVSYHTRGMIPNLFGFIYQVASLGYMGVDLFFVLSGFVISYNYAEKDIAGSAKSWKQFMFMRFVRLYPVHLFTLLLSLGFFLGLKLIHLKTPKDFSGWTATTFTTNLLMVHAWLPYVHDSWNNASWSISCEWFVYWLFPILTWMFYKRLNLYLSLTVAFLMAIGPALVMAINPEAPFLALIKVVFEFTSGCLAYSAYRLLKQNSNIFRFRIALWLLAFLVLATWLLVRLHNPAVDPGWLASIYPLAIVCWSIQRSGRWSFLSSRWMLAWGRASYSLYMTHNVTLWLLKAFVHERPGLANLFVYSIWLVAIACAAYLTYRFVEEPSRVYLRKLASSPSTPLNAVLSR